MSANSIPESGALSEGASLWIIRNNPSLIWWQKLDVNSRFLLSQNLTNHKRQTSDQLQNIITATDLKLAKNIPSQNHLLLGSEDHFLNKWILLWNELDGANLAELVEKTAAQLHPASIRFFSDSNYLPEIISRLSASSISISYIENT